MNDNELQLSQYDYELPPELIAQEPAAARDHSRLLVLDRTTGAVSHRVFADIVEYLRPGDCLVINRTRVVPARLFGSKETGGKAEALFLRFVPDGDGLYPALVRPFLQTGKRLRFPGGLSATVAGKNERGEMLLQLSGSGLVDVLTEHGHMPLPPYIKRKDETHAVQDRERYQTVYAREQGSVAAPTAGLHFTGDLLAQVRARGIAVAEVVLHVGWGTFRPVVAADVRDHTMLPEYFVIDPATAAAINTCKAAGGRVVGVGTTSVRALESAAAVAAAGEVVSPCARETSIFIYPGYRFRVIDALVTNFHLPHSTPLLMASAFGGRTRLLAAYREAIEKKYRFYSYGDAMFIL
jgi:S-adenosylmethionine:tRNA ribosyltransferase-isomerase